MKQRPFGRTGLQVSELVFGGGWVGGILIHQDDDTKREALRRALAAGINWVDTAPSYGQGRSEEALGWLLAEIDEQPYLSTKVGLDPERLDDTPGQIEKSLEESLGRLRRDSVDLLQLHNPIGLETTEARLAADEVLKPGGVADTFERLREQGLFRFAGITALGDAPACRRVIESERFDSAQVYYNLLNPSAARTMPPAWSGQDFGGLVDACERTGTAVMAIRILAAGVLATDERTGREVPVAAGTEVATEERRAHAVLETLGDAYGTRAQTAIRFALSEPRIACAIVGMAELAHLDEALAAAEKGPLPEEALAKIESVYERGF